MASWDPNYNLGRSDWWLPLNDLTDEPFSNNILLPWMSHKGIIPTSFDILIRRQIVEILEQIVDTWVKRIALRDDNTKELNAVVVPYGSYQLGVYSRNSDMDILVVAPEIASLEHDFFVQLRQLVDIHPASKNVRGVEGAIFPLIKFDMLGVEVDLAFARVNRTSIPRAENLHEEQFCIQSAADSQSRMSLESVRSNWIILQAVGENRQIFVDATRLLKHWASSHGIYGNLNCYLGGIHLSVMVAYACVRYKGKSLAGFVSYFFATFAGWVWMTPVSLQSTRCVVRPSLILPIQKPGTDDFCKSNVTSWTIKKIKAELLQGFNVTRNLSWMWVFLLERFPYDRVYTRFPYDRVYTRFVKVRISVEGSNLDKWLGFVKSRLAVLVRLLERDGIPCDPDLTDYMDLPSAKSTGFRAKNRVFLWEIVEDSGKKYDLTRAEEDWRMNLMSNGDGSYGQVKLAVIPWDVFLIYKNRR